MKNRHFVAAILAIPLLANSPASAADDPAPQDPQALASEAVQNLMRAMELLLLSIPQYEAPTMNENGDIIIRRKNPKSAPEETDKARPRGHGDKAI